MTTNVQPFVITATTKAQIIDALALALEKENFKVPYDYADELRRYEVAMSSFGNPKFSAPAGQHDDRVISLALAWRGISEAVWLLA